MTITSDRHLSNSLSGSRDSMPTCSSSLYYWEAVEPSTLLSTTHSPLHLALIGMDILDSSGKVTENFLQKNLQLPPFPSNPDIDVDTGSPLQMCMRLFMSSYPEKVTASFKPEGVMTHLLGWRYFCEALRHFGVKDPEQYFTDELKRSLETISPIRELASAGTEEALLQSFFDSLLHRVNTCNITDDEDWIKKIMQLSHGRRIFTSESKTELAKHSFRESVNGASSAPLKDLVVSAENNKPYGHSTSIFFNLLNAMLILGNRISPDQVKSTIQAIRGVNDYSPQKLPHNFRNLNRLFVKGEIPTEQLIALLEVSVFISDFFKPYDADNSLHITSVSNIAPGTISLQLGCSVAPESIFYFQLHTTPAESYQKLLRLFAKNPKDPGVWEFLSHFLLNGDLTLNPNSHLVKAWKDFKINTVELRRLIAANLNTNDNSLKLLNFLLLASLHRADPSPLTENRLLQLFPEIYALDIIPKEKLLIFFDSLLGSFIGNVIVNFSAKVNQSENSNLISAWLRAFLDERNTAAMSKLSRLFPHLQDQLPVDEAKELLKQLLHLLKSHDSFAAFELLVLSLEKTSEVDPSYFALFSQIVFPFCNPQSREQLTPHLKRLGEVLKKFASTESLNWSPGIKHVLFHVVDSLLDSPHHNAVGKEILSIASKNSALVRLFDNFWRFLHDKAFANNSDSNPKMLSDAFVQKTKKIRQNLSSQSFTPANYGLQQLVLTETDPKTEWAVQEELTFVWGKIIDHLAKNFTLAVKKGIEVVYDPFILKRFPEFCLEKHLFLLNILHTSQDRFDPDLIQKILTDSLVLFHAKVPETLLKDYTRQVLSLIKAKGISPDLKDAIQVRLMRLFHSLDGDSDSLHLLLSLVITHSIPISDNVSEINTVMTIAEKALRDCDIARKDQISWVNFLKNLCRKNQPTLSTRQLLTFCRCSFSNKQTDSGTFWLESLLTQLKDERREIQLVSLPTIFDGFAALSKRRRHHQIVAFIQHYHKLNLPLENLEPFITDELFPSYSTSFFILFDTHLFAALYSENRSKGTHQTELLLRHRLDDKDKNPLAPHELKSCISLLQKGNITDQGLWKSILTLVANSEDLILKQFAFVIMLERISNGLFSENVRARVDSWLLLTSDANVIPYEIAIMFLKDDTQLRRIFSDRPEEMLPTTFLAAYSHLYAAAAVDQSKETYGVLVNAHAKISEHFRHKRDRRQIWQLDLHLLDALRGDITYPLFLQVQDIFKKRMFDKRITCAVHPDAIMPLAYFTQSFHEKSKDYNSFILSVVNTYMRNSWVVYYLLECTVVASRYRLVFLNAMLAITFDALYTLRTNENINEQRPVLLEQLMNYIKQSGKKYPHEILELLCDSSIRNFFGEDFELLIRFYILVVLESVPNEDASLPVTQRNDIHAVIPALDLFRHKFHELPVRGQLELWELAIAKITRCAELANHENFPLVIEAYLLLCSLPFSESVVPLDYYERLQSMIQRITKQVAVLNPSALYFIRYYLIHEMLKKLPDNAYNDLKTVCLLLEDYFFEITPINSDKFEIYKICVNQLMTQFNQLTKDEASAPYFTDPSHQCLRGFYSPKEFLLRMAQSNSPYILSQIFNIFTEWDHFKEQISLDVVEQIFLTSWDQTSKFYFTKVNDVYVYETVNLRYSYFIQQLWESDNSEEKSFALHLARGLLDKLVQFAGTPENNESATVRKYIAGIESFKLFTLRGFFDNDPESYWGYCREFSEGFTRAVAKEAVPENFWLDKGSAFSMQILSGLTLLDDNNLSRVGGDTPAFTPLYEQIHKDLILDPFTRIIKNGAARALLAAMQAAKWYALLPSNTHLQELTRRLVAWIDSNPIPKQQPRTISRRSKSQLFT